jgi:hypothetical protein
LTLIGIRTRPDHDVADNDLEIGPCDSRRRIRRAVVSREVV